MAEPVYVTRTRTAHDTVADSYAEALRDALEASPWDRAVLGTFAELVGGAGPVGDLGCGPGRLTGHLASLGLQPDFAAGTCTAAGLEVEARLVREPRPPHEKTPQACLLARKPG